MTGHALVVRLDSMGDMLVCGPAIRAVAADSGQVTVLAGPRGAEPAWLLPGVTDVLAWDCPWIAAPPAPQVSRPDIDLLIDRLRELRIDEAIVLTSFHQSALPTALVLRLAGIARICAVSEDYPGSLLDVRIPPPAQAPEPQRMLCIARAAGHELPAGDDGALRVVEGRARADLPSDYVVVHPGADAPARTYPLGHWARVVQRLTDRGQQVVLTGSATDAPVCTAIAETCTGPVLNLSGRTDVGGLADVLRGARVVLVANTGPAHLAAAVGAPIVCLFAPVVPARRWAPFAERVVVLGDQQAPCRGSRARDCPVPGHPCLAGVDPDEVVRAADLIAAERVAS